MGRLSKLPTDPRQVPANQRKISEFLGAKTTPAPGSNNNNKTTMKTIASSVSSGEARSPVMVCCLALYLLIGLESHNALTRDHLQHSPDTFLAHSPAATKSEDPLRDEEDIIDVDFLTATEDHEAVKEARSEAGSFVTAPEETIERLLSLLLSFCNLG